MNTELVTIGIALLGIILGTWALLRNIIKKIDKLLVLTKHANKKEECPNHTSSTQADD